MASESIDILVAAENRASPVFDRVGADAERLGVRVKESGKRVKASTELVGTFANVLGNTQFVGVAGQLAQLTERVSAFSEMSKAGAAGALAFKLGLIGAAAVVTYKTTEIIASWWFELDKVKASAEEAAKSFAKLEQSLAAIQKKKFAETREDLSLVYGSENQDKATIAAAEKLEQQARDIAERIEKETANARQKYWEASDAIKIPFVVSPEQDAYDRAKATVEDSKKSRQALIDEANALRELVGARAKSIEARKAENALLQRSDTYVQGLRDELAMLEAVTDAEKRKIMAGRNAPTRSGEAVAIQERIDALKEEQSEQKRIEAAQDRELDRLELKRIELEKGKEAARAYALEMEGMSEEFARNIAAREAALDAMTKSKPDNSPEMAVQGRLLTQGNVADPVVEVLKKILSTNEKNVKSTEDVSKALRESARDEPWVVKTVTVP